MGAAKPVASAGLKRAPTRDAATGMEVEWLIEVCVPGFRISPLSLRFRDGDAGVERPILDRMSPFGFR